MSNMYEFHNLLLSVYIMVLSHLISIQFIVQEDEHNEESPKEIKYEVLFDEPFLGGLMLRYKPFLTLMIFETYFYVKCPGSLGYIDVFVVGFLYTIFYYQYV